MFKIDPINFIDWVREKWNSRLALIVVCLIAAFALIYLFAGIDFGKISISQWILIILVVLLIIIVWFFSRRIPRTPEGKIGFVVAISTENQNQNKKLKVDFIETLQRYISQGELEYQFSFIIYSEYHASKITSEPVAVSFLEASKGHFILYGRCRERNINGKQHLVLDLQGVVRHVPIPKDIRDLFAAEFTELLPNRLAIPQDNDLFSFEFASDFIGVIAQYIVATAAYHSFAYEYSKSLFALIRVELSTVRTNIPSIVKIKQRIPQKLADTIVMIAYLKYLTYRKRNEVLYLDEMGEALKELSKIRIDHYSGHLLTASYIFLKYGDTKSALKEINKCKGSQDGAWIFSYAFLKAYDGDLKLSHNRYKTAFTKQYADIVPIECEEFILDVLEGKPEKYQLYYCLGLINYYAKTDYEIAKKDFEIFLSSGRPEDFIEHRELAENYLSDINKKLNI